jgi:hydroxyacylglutathione hydrolase
VPGAANLALQRLVDHLDQVPGGKPLYVYCGSGHRSTLAASFLRSRGLANVVNVTGGFTAWSRAGLPIETSGP